MGRGTYFGRGGRNWRHNVTYGENAALFMQKRLNRSAVWGGKVSVVEPRNCVLDGYTLMKLLTLLRTVLINIGLIKMFFSIFMPTLLELEVYRFVCDFILFMIRAKRTTCAHQNSLDWIGFDRVSSKVEKIWNGTFRSRFNPFYRQTQNGT